MDFEQEIEQLFLNLHTAERLSATEFGSPYALLYFKDLALYIHCIRIDEGLKELKLATLQKMSMRFFSEGKNIVHLWQDQFLKFPKLYQDRLNSISEKNERIHARSCKVKRIDQELYHDFLNQSHLLQHAKSKLKYGMFLDHELVAVMGIGAGRWMTKEGHRRRSFEIIRFASMPNYTIVGGFTKFLNHIEQEQGVDEWMTYMDLDWAVQGVYQKFEFQLKSVRSPNTYLIDPLTWSRTETKTDHETNDHPLLRISNAGSIKLVKQVNSST
jgi:hypothetical protein